MKAERTRRRSWRALAFLATALLAVVQAAPAEDLLTSLKVDFGAAETEEGYVAVDNAMAYARERGYGWVGTPPGHLRDRNGPDPLLRDFVFGRDEAVFRLDIKPGLYRLTMTFGDTLYGDHFIRPVLSCGGAEFPRINPDPGEFVTAAVAIEIPTSSLDITFMSANNNWVLNALTIEPASEVEKLHFTFKKLNPGAQEVCLPEMDPSSPRHTVLASEDPESGEVVRIDVDDDGDPDILERWWNGKRIRWFDENDDMREADLQGDLADDSLQIDRDGDGYYDGPNDMNVDWVDNDSDGDADLQVVAMNPSSTQPTIFAGESHYMIFEDIDDDNVDGCAEWQGFTFPCWRITGEGNFTPDYQGNSIFLKEHAPPFAITDPRYSWENPFAFYDMDGDGVTEMTVRFCDTRIKNPDQTIHYDGKIEDAYVSYDLDNDSQRDNEMDFDMTIHFSNGKMDYADSAHSFPKLKAPKWVLPYFRYTNWREIDELIYVPHSDCYDAMFASEWGTAKLTFDEDDDDHRWERVELYQPDDPYITEKWGRGKPRGMSGHPQADSLGDRGEFDEDNSGKGRLYIGAWDRRIHLHGAEWGAWSVDEYRDYWGSWPVVGGSSPRRAESVRELVRYDDTDGNGFFDTISYDYDGDQEIDLRVSLLDYANDSHPHPDAQPLIDPAKERWEGMHIRFLALADASWAEAKRLHRAAWKKGLSTPELEDLAIASSVHQKYDQAYFLKDKILRRLLDRAHKEDAARILELYFTGQWEDLASFVETNDRLAGSAKKEIRIGLRPGIDLITFKKNGGWCWYQDERAIVSGEKLIFGTVAGTTRDGSDRGDVDATSYDLNTKEIVHFTLAQKFQSDDHDVPAFLELPDGRVLTVYQKHGSDPLMRWRVTTTPHDIAAWTEEQTFDLGGGNTYSNLFRLSEESNRIYNFSRVGRGNPRGANPNYAVSDDLGRHFRYGGRLLVWPVPKGDPKFTGIDGARPYLKYASNNKDTVHFITTEDHPRAYDNSIYHGYYRNGKVYGSDGVELGPLSDSDETSLRPNELTRVFEGDVDNVAWTIDLHLDDRGRPYCAFSVQKDGRPSRGRVGESEDGKDHRYYYARWDGTKWNVHEMAHAGTRLYPREDDYTGLVALHPNDPDTVFISTDAHPVTGSPLISAADGKRHYQIYRGTTSDGGKTWNWEAITRDSTVDNLRPIVPIWTRGHTALLWLSGDFRTFTDYNLDVVGLIQ